MHFLDNLSLFNIPGYESLNYNLHFYCFNKLVFAYGGIEQLLKVFPDKKLTFDKKFFPKFAAFSSTQNSMNQVGEIFFRTNGTFVTSMDSGSFSIFWIIN